MTFRVVGLGQLYLEAHSRVVHSIPNFVFSYDFPLFTSMFPPDRGEDM